MAEAFDVYLDDVGRQIRWKRVRPAIRAELRAHLDDQAEAYRADGMDEAAAQAEAVRQMGDAEAVGLALDHAHRPKKQTAILLLAAAAAVLGAYFRVEVRNGGSGSAGALAAVLLTFGFLAGGYFSDYRRLGLHPWLFYGVVLALGAVCARHSFPFGYSILPFGDLSEYAAFFYPAAFALAVYALRGRKGGFWLSLAALLPFYGLLYCTDAIIAKLLAVLAFTVVLLTAIRAGFFRMKRGWAYTLTLLLFAVSAVLIWYRALSMFHESGTPFLSLDDIRKWRESLSMIRPELRSSWSSLFTPYMYETGIVLPLAALFVPLLPFAALLLVRAWRLQNPLGRMLCLSTGAVLAVRITLRLLYLLGIFPLYAMLPFWDGNALSIADAALLGLTLSALRQSSCPEDAPKPPRPAKRLSERLVEAGKILFYSTHVCL